MEKGKINTNPNNIFAVLIYQEKKIIFAIMQLRFASIIS